MKKVNIHKAKIHLSRLVEDAARGESFVIAKAGKASVKVSPLGRGDPSRLVSRIGFLAGHISVPDDFDSMARDRIATLFGTGH